MELQVNDLLKQNHLQLLALYKACRLEQFFYKHYWDGFTSFDDFEKYGDAFLRITITDKQLAKYDKARNNMDE